MLSPLKWTTFQTGVLVLGTPSPLFPWLERVPLKKPLSSLPHWNWLPTLTRYPGNFCSVTSLKQFAHVSLQDNFRIAQLIFPDYNLSGLSLLRVRLLALEEQFHWSVTCFEGLLAAVTFASGVTCSNSLVKNQGALQNRTGMWSCELLLEGGPWEGAEWFFSPLPPWQHHFSWWNYHPLFLLAALLQAVCVKNHHFFCQAVLTGIWSLNSNCSLIAFLSTIHNLPGLLVYFGRSRDVSQ